MKIPVSFNGLGIMYENGEITVHLLHDGDSLGYASIKVPSFIEGDAIEIQDIHGIVFRDAPDIRHEKEIVC